MTINMFRGLNELISDIVVCGGVFVVVVVVVVVVVDKRLETTSIVNYSKRAHRIKNAHMPNMSLLLLVYTTRLVAH